MSKIEVVYIGPKKFKKDTVTGSRLVFPQHKVVPVDADVAHRLLEYPAVFVLAEDAKAVINKQKRKESALAKAKQELEDEQKAAQVAESFIVMVADGELDIAKYSVNQLSTLIEAEDLEITEPKNPPKPYRLAIRDALRKKNGTPELEGDTDETDQDSQE